MNDRLAVAKLQTLLAEYGIRVHDYDQPWETIGFPVVLTLRGGHRVVMDLSDPSLFGSLDPKSVGIALVSPKGRVKQRWGIALELDAFNPELNVLDSELGTLLIRTLEDDETSSIYLDGRRYYVSKVVKGRRVADLMVMVMDAEGERQARLSASIQSRSAEMFRRIGKALAMHQTLNELATLAVHEIAASAGLGAVMLWARFNEDEDLTLRAHVGISRQGVKLLEVLQPKVNLSCAAEMVASRKKTLSIGQVKESQIAQNLEGKICYLPAGGALVMPLIVGDRLIGVLELVGREDDLSFAENRDAFEVIAEHLSLALNTCLLFESAERMASFDPLTGIANHRALQDFLQARVSEASRTGQSVSVAMLDVDHFRAFNEEEGHDAGDFVLREVAKALKDAVRPYDLPARYGGEEFTIVMPGVDLDTALDICERVRARIERIEYVSANGHIRHVTASIGVSAFPETSSEIQALFKAADSAMYKAKRSGRNNVKGYIGPYREEGEEKVVNLDWMDTWISDEDRPISEAYHKFLAPFAEGIVRRLNLSKAQTVILDQLVRIYPTYKRMMAVDDPDVMRQLELAQEFRPLLPSLMTLRERYDGSGPMKMAAQKIPLLSRVLSVLLAIVEERGTPLLEDPARFDPEIVGLIVEVDQAA